ncbi:hypothetical protein, partial [Sandarakinorhabdus sp.]|uniref:hypothetical protein n=1 Tax=Sandarakinorhabdus sp. TaxID=1916663 RepID=UPI00286DBA4F
MDDDFDSVEPRRWPLRLALLVSLVWAAVVVAGTLAGNDIIILPPYLLVTVAAIATLAAPLM